jgi:hypothetical protein
VPAAVRIPLLGFLGLVLLMCAGSASTPHGLLVGDDDAVGNASAGVRTAAPNSAVQAAFLQRSYAPGAKATLALRGTARVIRVQLFRAGYGGEGRMQGKAVTAERIVQNPVGQVQLSIGSWPSGLYYARVDSGARGAWDAPFVLRPRRIGEHRVAIVLPTNTWQAYNYEDGGSWYLNAGVTTIDLTRPYIDAGVPPHYHGYDRGFIRWLALHHDGQADFFSDDDLDRLRSAEGLAQAYDLVVFSGHEEYVTAHEFDVAQHYRDLGGNLAFLSANNFFYKVTKHGSRMHGRRRWRDVGRPEASLVGAQYVDWNHGKYTNVAYQVIRASGAPWLFRSTGLRDGSTFGVYGIEVDAVAPSSPPQTKVLARIANIFGPGESAEMTYYATPRGAKVFAAGVMNFGGSALWPQVRTMIDNLWVNLSAP